MITAKAGDHHKLRLFHSREHVRWRLGEREKNNQECKAGISCDNKDRGEKKKYKFHHSLYRQRRARGGRFSKCDAFPDNKGKVKGREASPCNQATKDIREFI